ncbi:beta-galactosidase [Streptomyces sp. NBRC 110611]|nr:beta-galactosidase [Streptomyces sp. NBRC 110611]
MGIARFIAATSDWATSTQAHIAAVTERRPARGPAARAGEGVMVEVMAGTLESGLNNLKCKVCTP